MRKLFVTLTLAILAMVSFAQIPQTMSYQGVVRDADNKLVADKQVTVSVQILQGTDDGTAVYSENHEVTTNANGLMTFELGSKDAENFAKIDWSNAPYFVKTVAEFDGKQIQGVTPLLAVPYALYAAKAGSADVDLSNYATKGEIPSTEGFATKEDLNALNIPSVEGLASETYVNEKVAAIEIPSTEGFATKEELNALNIPSVEGLASETYVNEKVAAIEIPSTDGFATKEELNALNIPSVEGLASESYVNEKVAAIEIPSTEGFATKEELNALNIPSVEGLASESYVNEKVASIDLNDYYPKADVDAILAELNAKIKKLDKQLNPPPVGSISGLFSIAKDKQIYFSQGNLQYQASTGTWRFAEHQYDIIGDGNLNISEDYEGWIDMFRWGTSGYNDKNPYMTSTTNADYGDGTNDIASTNYDWGMYNSIFNGGKQAGMWRTLTKDEWEYLINERANAKSKKGIATINGVTGIVLLPDDWTLPEGLTFISGTKGDYAQNTYSTFDWSKMEANGAAFLPAAGYSTRTKMNKVGEGGNYWSSSYAQACCAFRAYFNSNYFGLDNGSVRNSEFSVRVVKDVDDVDDVLSKLNAKIQKLDKQLNPTGAIEFAFSVSTDNQVYFSQGNLQYQASTSTWRFAGHQYDIIGENNSNISSTNSDWIDLFGWGTSGYNGKNPYITSQNNTDYVNGDNDIAGTNYDWGVYNAISNGENQIGLWRTLTSSEWSYLIYYRANASNKKGVASVNGVNGLILLPDEWTLPDGIVFTSGFADGQESEYYATVNNYTVSEWSKMEANGAVFLPAAGIRRGTDLLSVGGDGNYWSSSSNDNGGCEFLYFLSINANPASTWRYFGYSVRLVRDVEE